MAYGSWGFTTVVGATALPSAVCIRRCDVGKVVGWCQDCSLRAFNLHRDARVLL